MGLAAALVAAAPASANPTQLSIVQDEGRLLREGTGAQSQALDEIKALGADVVKVTVNWRPLAPSGSSKPSGFVGDDPAQYNAVGWAPYDSLVRGAAARGLKVMFLVGGRAPDWAVSSTKEPKGSYRPSAVEFGRFVKALGTRYSGSYNPAVAPGGGSPPPPSGPPPCQTPTPPGDPCPTPIPASVRYARPAPSAWTAGDSGVLPRVDLWAVWNEPNLSGWLQPQYTRKRVPVSPQVYRGLFLAAHDAFAASGHAQDQILMGDLLPFARSGKTYPARVSPLRFLRELACVNNRYRAYRGKRRRARAAAPTSSRCPAPAWPTTRTRWPTVPRRSRPLADDATINDLTRLDRTLKKLSRRFVDHKMPIWITEFGYQTDPPDPFASPIALVPRFMSESEWLAYHDRRVRSYAQYPLSDDSTAGRGLSRFHGFQSGIDSSSDRPKKFVYQAFQTPLFVRLVSRSSVEVFGGVRIANGGTASLQVALGKTFRPLATVTLNRQGYFDRTFRLSRAASRKFRLVFGTETSNVAKPFKRPRAGTLYPRKPPRHKKPHHKKH